VAGPTRGGGQAIASAQRVPDRKAGAGDRVELDEQGVAALTKQGTAAGARGTLDAGVNADIARRLEEVGRLLAEQGANSFRVQAYENAAATLRGLGRSAAEVLREEGVDGLERLPGIGPTIARAIRDIVRFGRLPMLERLRGEMDPERLLASVPGIGRRLARRLHEELGINSLEDLEAAAHDGRLAMVAGFGAKRIAGIIDTLASRLRRVRARARRGPGAAPEIAELLDVDREYRLRAAAGELRRIAPRRFNPEGEAWLPVLHTQRGGRHYTALFSNTARAHELGRTRDWVVLYHDGGAGESQNTVITAERGPLLGRRLVTGREAECRAYYEGRGQDAPAPDPGHGA
jgi:DNA polymerase (family 10)